MSVCPKLMVFAQPVPGKPRSKVAARGTAREKWSVAWHRLDDARREPMHG